MDWIRTLAGLYLTSLHILAGNPSLPTSHPATAVHFRRAEPQAKPAPEVQAAIDRLDQATKSWLADKRLEALRLAEGALPTLRTSAPASDKLISCLNLLGKLNVQQNPKAARPYFDEAFRLENSRPSINLVDTLIGFGNLAEDQGDFPAAEQWYSKARDAARGAKKTHAEGAAWVELGNTHRKQFKYAQAIQDYKHARELASGRPMDIEDCDNNIGLAEFEEGDLTDARVDFSRVLDERKRLDITGIQVANSLVNLSLVEFQYGDLVQSSSYLNEAEKIYRKVDPNSAVMAVILNDRGNVEMEKGDYVAAEADYRSALAMDRAVQEKSTDVASDLMSVSHVLQEEATLRPDARGSFAPPQARRKADQDRQHLVDGALRAVNGALEIVPGNPTALTLKAEVFGIEHQFEDAKRNLRLAIGAIEPAAPNSLDLANCYGDLGSIEAENGELPAAEADFAKAYAVCSHAPNTLNMARLLTAMGGLRLKQGRAPDALLLFIRARGIIDSQRRRIGGPDLRQLFDETFSAVSAGTVDTYANLHRDVEAFAAAEASRGRSLAQSLVEHQNVGLKSAVPQALRDEQFQLDNQRAIALQALGHLNVGDPKNRADYDRLDSALGLYAAQQRNLDERIRQTSPHYANLGDPEPMDLPAVQKVLDPGTLLIDYFVGKDHCYLFSATPEHFAMHRLDITRDELATEVNEFFDSVSDPRSSWNPNIAITLYRQLLVPLKDEIAKAKRLLICPNGVLWKVPFCALIDNGNASPERAHFLVETKPIHYVLSISVYAELKSELYRKRSAGPAFVGFGDPSYEMSNQSNSLGAVFARIPLTGIQVKAISRMYNVPPYVGSAASRYSVMKHAPGARRVHFAVHAVANEGRDPLSSYLALSPEKASDAAGVLAASDVIENLRLDADLVALVGCQTGAGRLTDGEGVIGLARAFQYAGARTVVCSLWETTAAATTRMFSGIDPATSELAPGRDAQKACFYGALNADRTIDEALREAQLFLIDRRGGEKASKFRNPYFWAPFSVQGYWR